MKNQELIDVNGSAADATIQPILCPARVANQQHQLLALVTLLARARLIGCSKALTFKSF
jgi:hypothetical protein